MTFDFGNWFMKCVIVFELIMQTCGHRFVQLVIENGTLQGSINPKFAFMQLYQQRTVGSNSEQINETATENSEINESSTTTVTVILIILCGN